MLGFEQSLVLIPELVLETLCKQIQFYLNEIIGYHEIISY